MCPERRDDLPVFELFQRPAYWLIMLLPVAGFTLLHMVASRYDLYPAFWVPGLSTLGSFFYAGYMTRWLRRRWGNSVARKEPRAKGEASNPES